jgi:hypothetical protein
VAPAPAAILTDARTDPSPSRFWFEKSGPSSYSFEITSDRPAFVVFNETNYPGWALTYGNSIVEPVVTNMFLNGFVIKPGEPGETIRGRISYSNRSQRTGIILSGSTLLLIASVLGALRVRSRRSR